MPPELASRDWRRNGVLSGISEPWQRALIVLAIGAAACVTLAGREWSEMAHQWWNIDTYTHILLVPVIIAWLVTLKRKDLAAVEPRPWSPGLLLVVAAVVLWVFGRASGLNILSHAGAVGALQGVAITAVGPRASLILALPLCFGVFLVPIGDEIIPFLQAVTADISVALTHWSGIPARVDGIYIDTPAGLFIVAEACSGVKFLAAMVTLAVLVCFTRFDSWRRRAVFMATSIAVPILANGVRAWGTIYIAQSQGVEFAAGFDHIFYGWIFFAVVVAFVLSAAWRFFERDAEDYGWTAKEVAGFAWVTDLERAAMSPVVAVAGVVAVTVFAAIVVSIVAPATFG